MRYRISPGILMGAALLSLGSMMRCFPDDAKNAWGGSIIMFFSIFIFMIDFFLQLFIDDNKKLFLIEGVGFSLMIIVGLLA